MILRSITLEGWRCFIERVRVGPFSDSLNVLHAPNATGKSTLFDALLRGLLDSHRVAGRDVEAKRPWGRDLAPKVTVEFAHGGKDYRLTKVFLDSPSSKLECAEDGRFVPLAEGDHADERARAILTRNPPGRGLARPDNWGLAQVLWAPQGDVSLPALSGDVVADIRSLLGAQVSATAAGPIERLIEEAYLKEFTPTGRPRSGREASEVGRLRERLLEATGWKREALEALGAFENAARRVEDLRSCRSQALRDQAEITTALGQASVRAETYRALVADKARRLEQVGKAAAQHSELRSRVEAIKAAQHELAQANEELGRLRESLPLKLREQQERAKGSGRTKAELEDVRRGRESVDQAGRECDLARRYVDALRQASELDERLRRVREAEGELATRKEERSRLVAPDEKELRAIRKALRNRDDAKTRLEASLVTLEVVCESEGSLVVIEGEEPGSHALSPGRPSVVRGSPVVVDLPGVARIRAQGPAGSIEEIRRERDLGAKRAKDLTAGFGTDNLDQLESLAEKARGLDARIAQAATQIETLLSGDLAEDVEQQLARLATITAEILTERPAWKEEPPSVEALSAAEQAMVRSFQDRIDVAEAARDAAVVAQNAAEVQMAKVSTSLETLETAARSLRSKLADLASDGKTDETRAGELGQIALSWDAARAALQDIEGKIAALGEDPGEEAAKLQSQLEAIRQEATRAFGEEKTEEGKLAELSARGPYSALALAEEEAALIEDSLGREELRVAAIRLLRDTLAGCRAQALAGVVEPVESAVARTLQRIAGRRLGRVRLGDALEPAQVIPASIEMGVPVENVSGGEQEQLHLATRLALAEVLAKDERQLVVLDDVLLATDTGRMARVLRVLEDAAQRLQVLILTCHPERYRALEGANFVDLEAAVRGATTG
ncbi:MAG: AAA family ATPase [Actinomycetota bacterium]